MKKPIYSVLAAWLAVFLLFASGCAPAADISDGGAPSSAEDAGAEALAPDSAAPIVPSPSVDIEPAVPDRQIGVDFAGGDFHSDFLKAPDSAAGAELLSNETLSYITITPDTLIPKYYDNLGEIVFPRALTRGSEIFVIDKESKKLDFDKINSLEELKTAAASAFGFEAYYDSLVCNSYYHIRTDGSDSYTLGYFTDETDWEIFQTAFKTIIYLKFYNTAYGLRITDPWYKQGLWMGSDGKDGAGPTYTTGPMYTDDNYLDNYVKLNEFSPADGRLINAMPLPDALEIADSTRTENHNMTSAELVYICIPEVFGDEDYHLCWEIQLQYTAYYINCETGARWFDTQSE